MMLDWFLLLTPILLFPILLLFVFMGCSTEGVIGAPASTVIFFLRQNLLDPAPGVTRVYFEWTIESNGVVLDPELIYVQEYEEKTGDSGEPIREFRHLIENAEAGQWRVICIPYSGSIGFNEARCEFEHEFLTSTVQFVIVPDPVTGGRVQVGPGGCPV